MLRETERERLRRSYDGWAVWFLLLLVSSPVAYYGLRYEYVMWRAADAIRIYQAGHPDAGIAKLQSLLDRPEMTSHLVIMLAGWLMNEGRCIEAEVLTAKLVEKLPDDPQSIAAWDWLDTQKILEAHFRALVCTKQTSATVRLLEYWDQARQRIEADQEAWVNDYAYHCALAGVNLDEAERRMLELLESLGNQTTFGDIRWVMPFPVRSLAASGLVSLDLNGVDIQKLLALLNEKIEVLEAAYEAGGRTTRKLILNGPEGLSPTNRRFQTQVNRARFNQEKLRRQLVVLITVRGLLFQHAGLSDQAVQAKIQVANLGDQIERIAEQLPSFWESFGVADLSSYYLDTWGWLQFKQQKLVESFESIDLAILAREIAHEAHLQQMSLQGRSRDSIERYFENYKLVTATLLDHRLQLAIEAGDQELAESDRKKIRALGFQPGDKRFF